MSHSHTTLPPMAMPIDVIVAFRNRPIYLWNCLDALYRHTHHPARFTLIDIASDDPAIPAVVEGFKRRGMIAKSVRMPENDPKLLIQYIFDQYSELSDCFAYIEGDAAVVDRVWALAKLGSPERDQQVPEEAGVRIFSPHNPAGRFLLLRKQALAEVGAGEDWLLHQKLIAAGYRTGIAARVMHRHLSLLNLFDYADYDMRLRDTYMTGANDG